MKNVQSFEPLSQLEAQNINGGTDYTGLMLAHGAALAAIGAGNATALSALAAGYGAGMAEFLKHLRFPA